MSQTVTTKRKRRSPEALRDIVSQFDLSPLSRTAFCRKHRLGPDTFARWYGICGAQDEACTSRPETGVAEFIELGDADGGQGFEDGKSPTTAAPDWDIELQVGDGLMLRLRHRW